MPVETALLFETPEQIYERVFSQIKPRTAIPELQVRFRPYTSANSRIRLRQGRLEIDISDLLQEAPAPVQEALAHILIAKLYRKQPDATAIAVYRHYFQRADIRRTLHEVKQQRGRKHYREADGLHFNLESIFDELNLIHFEGALARPILGWSLKPSRTTLGHYDPSHHAIILSSLLDTPATPKLVVDYIMFHEMLHVRHPTQHKGSRRCIHTREFKIAERAYPRYQEARQALKGLLHQNNYSALR